MKTFTKFLLYADYTLASLYKESSMKHIFCISALLVSSCYGMNPSHEIGNPNSQPYQYITVYNSNINAPIMNNQITLQNITNANISDDSDSSEDEAVHLNQNNVHQAYIPNMMEEYVYENIDENQHYDTYSTPTDIDYPTTPTSERASTPSSLMSECTSSSE